MTAVEKTLITTTSKVDCRATVSSTVGSGVMVNAFSRRVLSSMENNVRDEQMDRTGARSSEVDRQDQRWSAHVTSSGRRNGDQERNVPAPLPSHQTEGQECRTQTPQSTRLTTEQEWSEQVPAAVHPSETEEWSVQPSQPLQILDAPRPEYSVPDRLWDWWNEDPPQRWQVDQGRWNDRVTNRTEKQQNRDWNQWSSWSQQ